MWICQLKEVRERRNRWHIEGSFSDSDPPENMTFSMTVRFGWLSMEGISGPLFTRVFEHFVQLLGEPKEPPTCAGVSECQDDAVHLVTSWEIGESHPDVASLLARLLLLSAGELTAAR